MSKLIFAQWYSAAGTLRVSLLVIAILGRVLLFIFHPPYFISKEALILPFLFLVVLDFILVISISIILVECIRILFNRVTSSWSIKKHFAIVFTLITVLTINNIFFVSLNTSTRYKNQGWSLSEKKDYKRAILSLDISLNYNRRNIDAYIERGYAYRELGDLPSALNDYNKVIELNSKNADGYAGRGYVYYYLGDCENAHKDWDTAISLDPKKSTRLEKWIKAVSNDL